MNEKKKTKGAIQWAHQRINEKRKWEIVDKYNRFIGWITGTYDKGEIQQKAKLIDSSYKATGKWIYAPTYKYWRYEHRPKLGATQ